MMFLHLAVKAAGLKKFFFQETVPNYVAVCSPEIATLNIGDEIITDAVMKHLSEIFTDKLFIKFPTQTQFSSKCVNFYNMASLRIIGGSNLMSSRIRPCYNQWDVSLWDFWKYKSAVLMGVGWKKYQTKANCLAKLFYKPLLSKGYIHSVRDSYTERQMRALGYNNVLNTACPTLWNLTPAHCARIDTNKRPAAVITITDYAKNHALMQKMIDVIRKNYNDIYFFQQGVGDLEYLKEITDPTDIHIIPPTLKSYDKLLEDVHPDFIGTRLHGGIRALQHSCRALIVGIDNRAIELSRDVNLPVVDLNEFNEFDNILKNGWEFDIRIPENDIRKWKDQFKASPAAD